MDATFLSELVEAKQHATWIPPNVAPISAILNSLHTVNATFGCQMSFAEAASRVTHLETRYSTFREMLMEEGTYWDQRQNKVAMSDKSWTKITAKNPLARGYFHSGEPQFYKLAILFGPTELKMEDNCPVINISDTTDRINDMEIVDIQDDDSEEVTSPVAKSSSKVRRKLYEDDADSVCCSRISNAWPLRNSFPPPPTNSFQPPPGHPDVKGENDTSSSCASSSPWKWFK